MHKWRFCHRVSLSSFKRPFFGRMAGTVLKLRSRAFCNVIRFGLKKALNAILCDNTQPMKGARTIRFMNEHSFTFLLAFPLASVERKSLAISSRFGTAILEGL
jgi:hypothetical protein